METTKNSVEQAAQPAGVDFLGRLWEGSSIYVKTVVDVAREPVMILDKDLRVMAANESFYRMFHVKPKDTERRAVYELGNGEWNIPELRKLLEDILPKNAFFKGFEVTHDFPVIGRKIMILNARQIHTREDSASDLILLAMEDVTDMMVVAETLASHANQLETKLMERTQKLQAHIGTLEQEINELKRAP